MTLWAPHRGWGMPKIMYFSGLVYKNICDLPIVDHLIPLDTVQNLIWNLNSDNFEESSQKVIDFINSKVVSAIYVISNIHHCIWYNIRAINAYRQLYDLIIKSFPIPEAFTSKFKFEDELVNIGQNKLLSCIINDDVEAFAQESLNYVSIPKINNPISCSNASAFLGSPNIFKFLLANNKVSPEICYYACYGRNQEIINTLKQKYDFHPLFKEIVAARMNDFASELLAEDESRCEKIIFSQSLLFYNSQFSSFLLNNGIFSKGAEYNKEMSTLSFFASKGMLDLMKFYETYKVSVPTPADDFEIVTDEAEVKQMEQSIINKSQEKEVIYVGSTSSDDEEPPKSVEITESIIDSVKRSFQFLAENLKFENDFNGSSDYGPIAYAVRNNCIDIASYLIANGAKTNISVNIHHYYILEENYIKANSNMVELILCCPSAAYLITSKWRTYLLQMVQILTMKYLLMKKLIHFSLFL